MIVTVVLPDLKSCIIHSIQPLAIACALVNSLKCHSHKPVYTIHSRCWPYILTPLTILWLSAGRPYNLERWPCWPLCTAVDLYPWPLDNTIFNPSTHYRALLPMSPFHMVNAWQWPYEKGKALTAIDIMYMCFLITSTMSKRSFGVSLLALQP